MHQREKTSFLTVKNEADKRSMKDTNSANSSDVPDKGKSSLRRTFCAVCGAQNVPENMRRPPQEAEYTIVLLASLCMQELIRSAQTKKIYSKRSGVRRRYICQDHYIQAAGHLGRKTKVIWGKFPQEGLCNLPEEILCKLVEDLRVYSENIDSKSRRSSVAPHRLGLMLALLVHRGTIDVEKSKAIYQCCRQTRKGKHLCETHFIEAAQTLVGELCGGITDYTEIQLHLEICMTSNTDAIPLELFDRLQQYMRMLDESFILEEKEITRLLNEAASRYGLALLLGKSDISTYKRKRGRDVQCNDENEPDRRWAKRALTLQGRKVGAFNTLSAAQIASRRDIISELTTPSTSTATDGQTGQDDWDQNFIVDGNQLKQLFQFCPCCGTSLSGVESPFQLKVAGTTPVVSINCAECRRRTSARNVVWAGQKQTVDHPRSRAYAGNILAAVAAITCGTSWRVLSQFAKETNTAFISKSFFCRTIENLRPAITKVYNFHRANVVETVKSAYEDSGPSDGWNIAVDGVYDRRCRDFYNVVAVDLKTKLCIHTEAVRSSETGGIRDDLEKEAFRRVLLRFTDLGIRIRSVTSDHCLNLKSVIDELNNTLSWDMEWCLDHRHLSRLLVKALHEASKEDSCGSLTDWIRTIKNHLESAVRVGSWAGDRNNIKFFFNTCLYRVAGVHFWKKDDLTGPYISCSHELLGSDDPQPIPFGSPAYEKFKEIVLQERFQNDLCSLSLHGDIGQCKKKNALDRLYCPREAYHSPPSYSAYVGLSALHLNTLVLAEMAERKSGHDSNSQNRNGDHFVHRIDKNNVEHKWRREIKDEYLIDRLFILEANQTVEDEVSDVDEEFSELTHKFEEVVESQEMYFESDFDDVNTDPESGSVCLIEYIQLLSVIFASHCTALLLSHHLCVIIGDATRLSRRAVLCDARMIESDCS
ncbi:hypothetical protein Y032_0668g1343 [Ancylostoma ceylanicum]|nr:hypothetical protein Y032_0668g1343 [Ancylostoma ceylanicum]